MKKRALRKDFYMEIIKSRGRFLSILFIVALGVAFFSGIRSSEPDMRYSADEYFDEYALYDGSIMSTMGLTDADIDAIAEIKDVEKVVGLHSVDVLSTIGDRQEVFHVISLPEVLNQLSVESGRLPEKQNECFVDRQFMHGTELALGDWITLESGNDEVLKDSLATDEYQIVGIGSSPTYISFGRGSTSIGTGEVSGFVYVTPESFTQEYYTEINISISGADELTAFTEPYDEQVQSVLDRIDGIKAERCKSRQDELKGKADIEIADAEKKLSDANQEADSELLKAGQKITDAEKELADGRQKLQDGKEAIEDAKDTLRKSQTEIDGAVTQYQSGQEQLQAGVNEYNIQVDNYNQQYPQAAAGISAGESKLAEARSELDRKWGEYQELLKTTPEEYLVEMETLLDAGETEWTAQKSALDSAREQLARGSVALKQAGAEIDANQVQLDEALAQINSGQIQINNGWDELKAKETDIKTAEQKITEGEGELESGKTEYDKAKKEADEKIGDARQEISDAKKKVADIELPEWYVRSRESSPDYTSYGENADRMKAIGRVFPILFFLVAALISLTTMTRMVEEQRTQIGTLKALGYSKLSIMSKYLNYALIATITGSVVGVLIGEKILPFVIVYAYKIIYQDIPNIVIPYNLQFALMATLAAVACTSAATLFSCYKELSAQPAVLMRPPAPQKGKRIILERLPVLWNRLNFTWKSTMRNLIRYKKRFLMTVFGIGGCMALMIVGFGIKDSVFGIGDIQYEQIELYDMTAYFKDDAVEEEKEELHQYLQEEGKVADYTDIYMKSVVMGKANKERDVYLFVPEDTKAIEQFISLKNRKSKSPVHIDKKGIVLTEKMSNLLDLKVGDKVELQIEEGVKKKVEITDICENYMGHYIYMDPELYQSLKGELPAYNGVVLEMGESTEPEILEVGEKILDYDGVLNVTYKNNMREQLDDMLGSLNIVIVVLIISAGMLAFVVLYNLNNININERQRELATIKVLGFYDKEVAAYVYRENILLTFIGCGVGAVLGKILHRFVIVTVEIDNAMFGRNIDFSSYVYSVLFTIGFSLFVNWVMYYKLKKINMVESLKSVE